MPSLKSYTLPITIGALIVAAAVTFFIVSGQRASSEQHDHETITTQATSEQNRQVEGLAEHSHLHGMQAVFYKSPTCGCCDIYAEELTALGVHITVVSDARRMYDVKQHYRIPPAGVSCHTFTLGEYVIEGHVPFEALEKLLAERPDIDGIVLGGMPIGTPGMPGEQTAPFNVMALKGGQLSPFVTL